MGDEFSEQVPSERQPLVGNEERVSVRLATRQIVPPEPHSTGPDFRKAWNLMPRWLQITLVLAFIVCGILAAIFIKG